MSLWVDRKTASRRSGALGRPHRDVDVGGGGREVPEGQGAVFVERPRHRGDVGQDAGDVRRRREGADQQGSVGVAGQLRTQGGEVDVAVGVLGDRDDVGDRFAPRHLVGMVLVGADEHHRSPVGRDLVGEVPHVVECRRDAQPQHADEFVDGVGRAAAAEQHDVVVGGADTVGDDGPRLLAEASGLESGSRRLGVGVGVQREHRGPEVVLDEVERAARRGVIGVDDRLDPERSFDDVVSPDDRRTDGGDQVGRSSRVGHGATIARRGRREGSQAPTPGRPGGRSVDRA